jgi:4'-phosphopantetheinyl transferase
MIIDPASFSLSDLAEAPLRPPEPLANQAHVWLALTDVTHCPQRRQSYVTTLSTSERDKYYRFHFERNRLEYLVAHTLVRSTLSRYALIEPRDWSFECNVHGRPEIVTSDGTPGLRFNLSHTRGLVACIVTNTVDCGIDVEYERPLDDLTQLACAAFSIDEQDALRSLPKELQLERFYSYWTLKEAYIKARGLGLSLPLQEFSFGFDEMETPSLKIVEPLGGHPDEWQVLISQATRMHKLAVALRRGPATDLGIVCRFVEAWA